MGNQPSDLLEKISTFLSDGTETLANAALTEAGKQLAAKQFDNHSTPAAAEPAQAPLLTPAPLRRKWGHRLRSFFGNRFTILALITVAISGGMIGYLEYFVATQQGYESITLTSGEDIFFLNNMMPADNGGQELLWNAVMQMRPEEVRAYKGERTLQVGPGRKTLRLRLKDSTLLILGPSSKVTLCRNYGNGARQLSLEGKAIFQVFPYRNQVLNIQTNGQQLITEKALVGVTAYPEANYEAALIHGEMTIELGTARRKPVPGQAVVQQWENGKITINNVDTSKALSWQKGCYTFTGDPLPEVFRQLESIYDVKIILEGDKKDYQTYTGIIIICKDSSLITALESLKRTDNIEYKIDNCGIVHVWKIN
jgi:hypothetical protein